MLNLLPVFTVLLVLFISVLAVRVATTALTLTGISRDLAQFQALSAFTGSGFTTAESPCAASKSPVKPQAGIAGCTSAGPALCITWCD